MSDTQRKAAEFHALHRPGEPVVLFNIWDPGSAATVEKAGARALATGSMPVAMAQGYADGEQLPMARALDNAAAIVAQTELPVTLDFEGAYSAEPDAVAANTTRALATGVVGFNFEDQIVGGAELYPIAAQVERLASMRRAIDDSGDGAFINSRTDLFLKAPREHHDAALLDRAIERAQAYVAAGAHGFFAPGLADIALIERLCAAVPAPVNIIALPGCPPKSALATAGVARISHGPVPWRQMMAALGDAAQKALA